MRDGGSAGDRFWRGLAWLLLGVGAIGMAVGALELRGLAQRLGAVERALAGNARPESSPAEPARSPAPAPGPVERSRVAEPSAARPRRSGVALGAASAGAAQPGHGAREPLVRAVLAERMERAFPDDRLAPADREAALDLLMEIRALRARAGGHGLGDAMPSELADALYGAQLDFADLTGMGVGPFLERLHAPEEARSLRPGEAPGPQEGEVRKRFADEMARRLGITEPGSVESRVEGEWQER